VADDGEFFHAKAHRNCLNLFRHSDTPRFDSVECPEHVFVASNAVKMDVALIWESFAGQRDEVVEIIPRASEAMNENNKVPGAGRVN
jgi:hypothetical protein